jgi:phenylacetic acid degradation operon negative regulatory protein
MRKRGMVKKILKITEGMFSSLMDLVLWDIFYLYEASPFRYSSRLSKANFLASQDLAKFNSQTLKRAIQMAKSKGWIKEDLTLTKEGKQRLESFLPHYFGKREWDGNWYLASYDIAERRRIVRNILRDNLKRLGFAKLHASLWISPFNFLGEIEKIIKDYDLSPFVILAVSNKLGREESKYLANRVWKLDKINERYKKLLEKAKDTNLKDLIFEYLSILEDDPQLPKELLPEDWLGEEAHLVFKNLFPLNKISTKNK